MRASLIFLVTSLAASAVAAPVASVSPLESPEPLKVREADADAASPVLENLERGVLERLDAVAQRSAPEEKRTSAQEDEDSPDAGYDSDDLDEIDDRDLDLKTHTPNYKRDPREYNIPKVNYKRDPREYNIPKVNYKREAEAREYNIPKVNYKREAEAREYNIPKVNYKRDPREYNIPKVNYKREAEAREYNIPKVNYKREAEAREYNIPKVNYKREAEAREYNIPKVNYRRDFDEEHVTSDVEEE